MIVTLNHLEVELCEWVGKKRSESSRANNVKDAKIGDQDGVLADIQGFKAEYAFAKKHNLFPDFGLTPRSGSYDGITKKGTRYDIKSTHYENGNLLCTLKVNPDIDIYILACVNDNVVKFVGWIKNEDFVKPENIKDLGHGKGYFMHRNNLTPFSE